MKLHLFYWKPSKEYVGDYAALYAYTIDKEFAEDFQKQRDMSKFIYKKEEISKKDYKEFASLHTQQKLGIGEFYTKSKIVYGKRERVKVLCTWKEEESIVITQDKLWEEFSNNFVDCKMLKDEYIKALEVLQYFKLFLFYRKKQNYCMDSYYEPYYTSYGPCEDFVLEDFTVDIKYDEFQLFLKYYQHTFKVF